MWEIERGWTTVTPPASSSSPSSRAPVPTSSAPNPPWWSSPRTTRRDTEPRRWSPIPCPSQELSVDVPRRRSSLSPPAPFDVRNLPDLLLEKCYSVQKAYVIHWVQIDRYSTIEDAYRAGKRQLDICCPGCRILTRVVFCN